MSQEPDHKVLRVLVVGCGHMGKSHAKAYAENPGFDIVGLVSRSGKSRETAQEYIGQKADGYSDYAEALAATKPDVACIATYPDTHAEYAIAAMKAGAHVFIEKPIATTVGEAERVCEVAKQYDRKLVVGYILRQHPSWTKFIEIARTLGKPLVMRMNLNQQSQGHEWNVHKSLMQSLSPIVDCGVHYIDVMCQMTQARPLRVQAIGARLTEEIPGGMYNYGALQVTFEDGSVGWYEAGWGPMMSREAYFVKDVIGPKGSVSIVPNEAGTSTDDVEGHTRTGRLLFHRAELDKNGAFIQSDETISTAGEPDHDGLCALEQDYLRRAICENIDLTAHLNDAVNSLRVVLAADQSFREGRTIDL